MLTCQVPQGYESVVPAFDQFLFEFLVVLEESNLLLLQGGLYRYLIKKEKKLETKCCETRLSGFFVGWEEIGEEFEIPRQISLTLTISDNQY